MAFVVYFHELMTLFLDGFTKNPFDKYHRDQRMRRIQPKLTILKHFIELFIDYTLQKCLFILLMLLLCFQVDENIAVKDYNEPVDIVLENTIC